MRFPGCRSPLSHSADRIALTLAPCCAASLRQETSVQQHRAEGQPALEDRSSHHAGSGKHRAHRGAVMAASLRPVPTSPLTPRRAARQRRRTGSQQQRARRCHAPSRSHSTTPKVRNRLPEARGRRSRSLSRATLGRPRPKRKARQFGRRAPCLEPDAWPKSIAKTCHPERRPPGGRRHAPCCHTRKETVQ